MSHFTWDLESGKLSWDHPSLKIGKSLFSILTVSDGQKLLQDLSSTSQASFSALVDFDHHTHPAHIQCIREGSLVTGELKLDPPLDLYRDDPLHDELTGFFTKEHFIRFLNAEIESSMNLKRDGSYLYVNFPTLPSLFLTKKWDDAERVFVICCRRIQQAIRSTDMMGRIGFGTLGIIMPDFNQSHLEEVKDRIKNHLSSQPLSIETEKFYIPIEMEGMIFPSLNQRAEDVLFA